MYHLLVGFSLLAYGADDCGLQRLYPSGITSGTVYSSSYQVENLIDGSYSTYWYSQSGYTSDNVYVDFATQVDVKHIMIREGTYYTTYIQVRDGNTGAVMDYTQSADTEDYKMYNFWFPKWITNRVRIYFSGSQGSYLTISTISFWGCNDTSTAPTVVPTISPTQTPTNNTPTVFPTNMPSQSPTQMPTNSTPSTKPTSSPSVSPSQSPTHSISSSPTEVPSIQPSLSPSMAPTPTLVPSSSPTMTPTSSLLPTSSPTLYPTVESTPTPDYGGAAANDADSDGSSFITIGVLEILIVFILGLSTAMICLCLRHYKRERKFCLPDIVSMEEAHEEPDRL